MNYINAGFGWLWRRKHFFLTMSASALLFTLWFFPFGDMKEVVTNQISAATNNQVYVKFGDMSIGYVPKPSITGKDFSADFGMQALTGESIEFSPSLLNLLFNIRTLLKAGSDPEAAKALSTRLSASLYIKNMLGGDYDVSVSPGKASEQGKERLLTEIEIESLELGQLQAWLESPVKMKGELGFNTEMLFSPDMVEQPSGDFQLNIKSFTIQQATLNTQMGPIIMPAMSFDNVTLKGRMVNGQLLIEEGQIGQPGDALNGRIKGQIGLRLQSIGGGITAIPGAYNISLDLNANAKIQKDLMIVFALLDSHKTPTAGGGAKYLLRLSGQGIGVQYPMPQITRLSSF